MLIIPSVAMNGGSRPQAMAMPLKAPKPKPIARPAAIAGSTAHPSCSSVAITTPESARTEPTDRSMPAGQDHERHADGDRPR